MNQQQRCAWMECEEPRASRSVFCARHSRTDRANRTDQSGRGLWRVMVVIVVGSALGWAYRESERAEQAASRLAQAQQRIERQLAGARLSASDRELLDALHEQAEAQRQQEAGQ